VTAKAPGKADQVANEIAPVSVAVTVAVLNSNPPTILEAVDFLGGPGRTRTYNQTVMSAKGCRKIQANSPMFAAE
jgi:hypothetical protein